MNTFQTLVAGALITVGAAGCAVNPVTGERQFSVMSAEEEIAIGRQHYVPSQQSQGGRYVVDPDLEVYIRDITLSLAEVSGRPGLPYDIVVLNSSVPNAWAMPGGKMAINRGLLMHLEDEAQLASVLGHEVVHAAARHSATQASRNLLLTGALTLAGVAAATRESDYAALAVGALGVGAMAWQARYSRSHELEADYYGVQYMLDLGYDPQGAVELQETFVRLSEGRQSNWLDGLFASHPPSQERVRANRELAEQNPGGKRNREAYQRATAQLRQDAPAYENYDQALKAANEGGYDEAMNLVQRAIDHQPRENLFWELKGQLHMQKEERSEAISAFDRSLSANPEFFRPYIYRGILHKAADNRSQAEEDLLASRRLLPTQLGSYHLGELAEARGARDEAVSYYREVIEAGGELGERAQQRMSGLQ
ncbi:M48 family metalloprotease [Marinimicrobium alkaliphilum]|uniref:M48 family metalloprotease n=1 Tax=Marinimicrobium alkaliphilum TaxID=2202654 RepID=UPI001E34CC26|nr:M48 family metalloprotease [Marinimicrobium alkaliphilum]